MDKRDPLSVPRDYRMPCSGWEVCVERTKLLFNHSFENHIVKCWIGHKEKSAIAHHVWSQGNHELRFHETQVLAQARHYHTKFNIEAREIQKIYIGTE